MYVYMFDFTFLCYAFNIIVFLIVILFITVITRVFLSFFCLDGIGELKYYTGDVYRGSWKDGLRHGKVIGAYICNCFAGILCNLSVLYTVAIVY